MPVKVWVNCPQMTISNLTACNTDWDVMCPSELLTAIIAHIPPPPDAVLAKLDLDALLDGTSTAISISAASLMPTYGTDANPSMAATQAEAAPLSLDIEAVAAAVSQDPHASLHAGLYHMLAQCQPDVFERLKEEQLLQQEGHDLIMDHLQLTRLDLCYHPRQYESWESVLSRPLTCCMLLAKPTLLARHLVCARMLTGRQFYTKVSVSTLQTVCLQICPAPDLQQASLCFSLRHITK